MVKNLPVILETWVQSLGVGRSPGEGNGNSLQVSCLENPIERRALCATLDGAAKSQTLVQQLSMHTYSVHSSTIYNSQDTEASKMSIKEN